MSCQLLSVALLFLGFSLEANSQIISTNIVNGSSLINEGGAFKRRGVTNTLTLPAGKQIIIHGINGAFDRSFTGGWALGFVRQVVGAGQFISISSANLAQGTIYRSSGYEGSIIGPMDIQYGVDEVVSSLDNYPQARFHFLFEIKDDPFQETTPSASMGSSLITVDNANSETEVVLEQSSDLITWTQCLPGSYNAATQKRFFRVRAVEK